jgi:hypothetical protein
MASLFDKFWIILANIFMVKLFKLYWPIGGSYWNKYHINKNNIDDIRIIIKVTNNYKEIHYFSTVFGLCFYSFCLLFNLFIENRDFAFLTFTFMESYCYMVQKYNSIIAKNRVKLLKLNK